MLAKIDAILAPFVRWTIIILGSGFLVFLYGGGIRSIGTNPEETFREVQAELDARRDIPIERHEAESSEGSLSNQGE
jgi:hypothetical protein